MSLNSVSGEATDLELTLSFTNLGDPGDDHYEGWLIVDGSPVSTGKFSLDANGGIVDLSGTAITTFSVSAIDLELATKFVLSLEPMGDTDTVPAAIKPLAGDLNVAKTSSTLTPNLGVDLGTVAGSYILATPTNDPVTNENSGIWFLDPTGTDPVAGLTLPDLTGTDWTYEGWVVMNGTPVTTGTFDTVAGVDASAPYSGTQAGPPFPGEDFLDNAPTGLTFPTDLSGMTAVISIEPRIDNAASPFQFKPLMGAIPVDAIDHTLYALHDMSSTLAAGTVSIAEVTSETTSTTSTTPAATTSQSTDDDSPGFGLALISLSFFTILVVKRKNN
ncbi:MAG: hypothetical protein IH840_12655 [Candidatus Heimdallarchaeota archaeon]|nr:hypothetical protein [Candidatus Heimdallarchaeota archaeon]